MIAALLTLAPALALVCALLLGGYPGERALARIARARARRRRAPRARRRLGRRGLVGRRCHEEAA